MVSGKVSTPRFLGIPINFRKISFLIPALQRKVDDGRKTGEKKTKKIMMEIVAKNKLIITKNVLHRGRGGDRADVISECPNSNQIGQSDSVVDVNTTKLYRSGH